MAGIKRKEAPTSRNSSKGAIKKVKKDFVPVNKPKPVAPRPQSESDSEFSRASDTSTDDDGEGVSLSSNEEAAILGPSAQERGEAESDSDPIVESDTTEQSGEDDGVSWPSDGDEDPGSAKPQANGKAKRAVDGGDSAKPAKAKEIAMGSNDASTGKKNPRSFIDRG